MKNQLFEDLIESIKELPTEILEEMRINMKCEYCDDTGTIYETKCGACNDVSEEQMRKEFEEWFDYISEYSEALSNIKYSQFEKHLMWNAWRASRETLVVELPSRHYSNMLDEIVMDAKSVYEALESQGIKWK